MGGVFSKEKKEEERPRGDDRSFMRKDRTYPEDNQEKAKKSDPFSWLPWKKDEDSENEQGNRRKTTQQKEKKRDSWFSFFSSDSEEDDPANKFAEREGVTLYGMHLSSSTRKVRLVLEQKKIKYKEVALDPLKGEQFCEEYLKLSPTGSVPAIRFKTYKNVPDVVLTDANVITEFIDRTVPTDGPLLVGLENDILNCRMWQDWETSLQNDFQDMFRVCVLPFIYRVDYKDRDEFKQAASKLSSQADVEHYMRIYDGEFMPSERDREDRAARCYRNLYKLEHALEDKQYLVNERLSMADLTVFPCVDMFRWSGLEINKKDFPNIVRHLNYIGDLDFVERSETSAERMDRRLLSWVDWFVVAWGNCKAPSKVKRFEGITVLPRVKGDDDGGNILEPAPKPDVPPKATIVYTYPVAAETWQVKIALKEMGVEYVEDKCDWLDLVGRPTGAGSIFRIQRGDKLFIGARTMLEAVDSFGWITKLIPLTPRERALCQQWQAWEQDFYTQNLYPLVEKTIFTKLMVSRFRGYKLDNFIGLRADPDYAPYMRQLLQILFFGLAEQSEERQTLQEMYPHLRTLTPKQTTAEEYNQIYRKLLYLEKHLEHKAFLLGSRMTLADICVFCRLLLLPYVGLLPNKSALPNTVRWMNVLEAKESFSSVAASVRRTLDRILNIDGDASSIGSATPESIPSTPVQWLGQEKEPDIIPVEEDQEDSSDPGDSSRLDTGSHTTGQLMERAKLVLKEHVMKDEDRGHTNTIHVVRSLSPDSAVEV